MPEKTLSVKQLIAISSAEHKDSSEAARRAQRFLIALIERNAPEGVFKAKAETSENESQSSVSAIPATR